MDKKHQSRISSEGSNISGAHPKRPVSNGSREIPQFDDLADIQKRFSPLRFLAIIIGGIFLAEIIAMILLLNFKNLPYYLETLIDASIMIVLIFPIIYFFCLRPLIHHIEKRQRAESALQQSETRFSTAFHSSPSAQSITRVVDGSFVDVNESFLRLSGYNREELIGHTSIELGIFIDPGQRADLVGRLREKGDTHEIEIKAQTKSAEILNVLVSTQAIELDNEMCVLATTFDITERKRNEARLRRFNRALKVLSDCNKVLVRSDNEPELLDKMCKIIVNTGEYCLAWVGLAEQDQARSVRPAAQFGFEDGYLGLAKITWDDTERGRGPTGTAIRTGDIQVNQNFLTNPNMAPWRKSALERGYQSSIALPIRVEKSILGALTIYSSAPDAFDADEISLLVELTDDLAFGIASLRERAERKRAEEQVREMALFPTLNPDAVLRVDSTGQINMSNPAANQMGLCDGAILAEIVPQLRGLELPSLIATGNKEQIQYEAQIGEKTFLWTVRCIHELGFAVLYGKDITERKRDADRLREAHDELELRVQDRTEELRIAISELEAEINEHKQAEMRIQRYSEELRAANEELTRFNRNMIGRELRMIELKKEVNKLCSQAGLQPQYPLDFEKDGK